MQVLAALNGAVSFQEGETPLHCAAARGNLDCVKVLLDAGVNLNATDKVRSSLHVQYRQRSLSHTWPLALA